MIKQLSDDPLWFKDAVIYELHVRAFSDSNGDGIGDFRGLVDKLDYLEDLGVTAIWLLPFYPSPLRDDGYDIAEYTQVNPSYGTLRDFRRFLRAAHARGLRVITELVINHTSTEHPWFQRARRSPPGSKYRNFYVWSDTPDKYRDARIIFPDFETSNWTWDPVARSYYWHRFYSHQPDLNFENTDVQKAIFKVLDFWMDMGVDGMRLDAVPYLYEREGTNCENLPETHEFLRKLRAHADHKYKNRMFLAEANQWPEDAAEYFGDGDECHMNFHFPLMPRMFMAVQQENNFPILDILEQTPKIPESCQWAVFLRNHDELTLEMVTDEDRDYMYRQYAADPQARINVGIRRRLGPLLKVRKKIELMNGLLMALPGTPVIYYGDEIGMGDNIYLGDRNSVRTPMQWSSDRNAGFSRANPQKLYLPTIIDPEYHYEAVNVEAQEANPSSLLWWMKRLLAMRKQYKVFGRGETEFLHPENPKVLAFIRKYEEERILVVANLSRFCQYVELDLRRYAGDVPIEVFGRTRFPRIGELSYLLTLGPHGFYWFELEHPKAGEPESLEERMVLTGVKGETWEKLLDERRSGRIEALLPEFLRRCRWFRGKAYEIRKASVVDVMPLKLDGKRAQILVIEVDYIDRTPERYLLPLLFASGDEASHVEYRYPAALFARLDDGILFDAAADVRFGKALLGLFHRKRTIQGRRGQIQSIPYRRFRQLRGSFHEELEPHVSGFEQTNTSILYDQKLILKLFRMLEEGENPDLEVGRYLTEVREFDGVPPLAGALEYKQNGKSSAVAILQGFVPNYGDAWNVTQEWIDRTFERVPGIEQETPDEKVTLRRLPLFQRSQQEVPELARTLLSDFLPMVSRLGERTAELHRALDRDDRDPDFSPEEFSTLHQRSLYQSGRTSLVQGFELLRKNLSSVPEEDRPIAEQVLERRGELDARLKSIVGAKIEATRIRCHGDYHLGQVLYTGGDFIIIDFEGEPSRSLGERRLKQSPLRDVAGMLRSFHYAAVFALRQGHVRPDDVGHLAPWADLWHAWVEAIYLRSYLDRADGASFIPRSRTQLETLLDFFLIEKCTYELAYELNNRPDWVGIPLHGLAELLDIQTRREEPTEAEEAERAGEAAGEAGKEEEE